MLQINAASKEDYSCYIIKEQKPFPRHFAFISTLMVHREKNVNILISLNMFYPHICLFYFAKYPCLYPSCISAIIIPSFVHIYISEHQSVMASHECREAPFIHISISIYIFVHIYIFVYIYFHPYLYWVHRYISTSTFIRYTTYINFRQWSSFISILIYTYNCIYIYFYVFIVLFISIFIMFIGCTEIYILASILICDDIR